MKKTLICLVLFVVGLSSFAYCGSSAAPGFSLGLIESRKIWDKALFNGFTDLIRFKGQWYISLREATAHGVWDGNIRIIRSDDGQSWESAAFIRCPDGPAVDLRDPKLSITPEGKLMLTSSAYWPTYKCASYAWFSSDGVNWGQEVKIGPPGEWLWNTEWHKGIAYNFGRSETSSQYLQLYSSTDGKNFTTLGPRYFEGRRPSETAPVFTIDGTCYVLLRRGSDSYSAQLGIAGPPYDDFDWKDLGVRIGGPEMILLPNGQLLATVRLYDDGEYTAVCFIDPKAGSLTKMLRIPSGGDTSYAGMVLDDDNILWISYYSSHEGKTSVYLAKLKVNFNDKPKAIDVGTQKQLFIDDYIIGEMSNVAQQLNQPVKYAGNPIFSPPAPKAPDTEELIHLGGSVIYDEEEGVFKMWYEANSANRTIGAMAYATSKDGINWDKPCMNTISFPKWNEPGCSEGFNNFLFSESTINYYTEIVLCVFKDARETDPLRRYKMIYRKDDIGAGSGSIWSAFSGDGLSWTRDKSIIPDADSFNSMMWDENLGKYVAHTRFNRNNHPTLPPQRQVLQSESDDFDNWCTYGVIMKPDGLDAADTDFYNMEWMPYEGVFVGFISAFHHDADRIDIQLAFSRDNRNWVRAGNRDVFIPNSSTKGDYDYGMVWNILQHPIVVGDEIFIYYNGCSGYHYAWWHRNDPEPWVQGGVIALAKLRLDGFVSVDASSAGTLTTKKMTMDGDKLVINADAKHGSIKVEILNADGKPIKGFSKDDADTITGDRIRHKVKWRGKSDLSKLKGKTILLKFYLNKSKLYSFVFKP